MPGPVNSPASVPAQDALAAQDGFRPQDSGAITPFIGLPVATVERALILETLARCGGNRTSAAMMLGISVRTMRNKLKSYADDTGKRG